jgi:glyoxylate utilization-related uncharacterized protein
MQVVKFNDAPHYTLPNHEQVTARRLQGLDASSADFVVVGFSEFPVGAAVPMEPGGSISKIYVVVSGSLIIEQGDGVRHELNQWDSIFIPPGHARAVMNEGSVAAAMLVMTPPPPK